MTGQPGITTTGTWGNRCCSHSVSKGRRPTSSWQPSPYRLTSATSNVTSTLGSTLNRKPTSPHGWVCPTSTVCGLACQTYQRNNLRWLTIILHFPLPSCSHQTTSGCSLSFCTCTWSHHVLISQTTLDNTQHLCIMCIYVKDTSMFALAFIWVASAHLFALLLVFIFMCRTFFYLYFIHSLWYIQD